jgi:ketosteroid isomerase-like protein
MRIRVAVVIAVLTVGGVARQGAKAAVARVEQRWVAALNRGDVTAIGAILAPDFVRPAPQAGAFIGRAALLAYYRKALSPHGPLHRRIEGMTIRVYGETAVARGFVVVTDSGKHTTSRLIFTDVFVERGGRWQAVSVQENAVP